MAGTTLATAWVQIVPSLDGAGKEISSQLAKVNLSSAGKSIGSSLGSSIASGLGSLTKIAGTVGATLAGVVTGVAAKGGIDRALSIENAQAKLTGLGHDASSVSQIMANALASVKGTVFGLGDAATVAASLSASGVQAGSQLETVLKTVADTAQISGRALTDVGAIFGSVAARGKLQGDDMLQLMSAGVPVLQLLAAHLGTTSAAVSDMVSKGQIDFQTFADAMQEGFGGAAQAAGTTFTGALANVKAALWRIGASAATPVLNSLRDVFNGLIPVIDQAAAALQPLFDILSSKLAAVTPTIVAGFQSLGDKIGSVSGSFGGLAPVLAALGPLAIGFAAPLLSNLPIIGKMLAGLTPGFGGIIGLFAAMVTSSPALQSALGGLIGSIAELVQSLLPSLTPLLGLAVGALQVAGNVLAAIIGPVAAVLGWLSGAGDLLGSLAVGVLAGVAAWKAWNAALALWQGIVKIGTAIQGAFNAVMSANPIMLVVIAIAAVVAALIWFFTQTTVGQQIWAGFMAWLQSAWQAIGDFFVTLWNGISSFVTGAINGIAAVIGTVTGAISSTWSTVWGAVSSFFIQMWQNMVAFFTPIIQTIQSVIAAVLGTISAIWNSVWGAVSGFFSSIWNGMVNAIGGFIGRIGNVIGTIWGTVMGVLGNVGSWLLGAGGDLVRGFWNGISGMSQWLWNQVSGFFNGVVDWAKGVLGIHSPSRVFRFQVGQMVGEGLALGLDDSESTVRSSMDALLAVPDVPQLGGTGAPGGVPVPAGGVQVVYNDNSHIVNPVEEPSAITKRKKALKKGLSVDGLVA